MIPNESRNTVCNLSLSTNLKRRIIKLKRLAKAVEYNTHLQIDISHNIDTHITLSYYQEFFSVL